MYKGLLTTEGPLTTKRYRRGGQQCILWRCASIVVPNTVALVKFGKRYVHIGKAPSISNSQTPSGALLGQISRQCEEWLSKH